MAKRLKQPAEQAQPGVKPAIGGPAKAALRKPKGSPVKPAPLGARPGPPQPPQGPGTPPGKPQPRGLPPNPTIADPMRTPPGPGSYGGEPMKPGMLSGMGGGGAMPEGLMQLLAKLMGGPHA